MQQKDDKRNEDELDLDLLQANKFLVDKSFNVNLRHQFFSIFDMFK